MVATKIRAALPVTPPIVWTLIACPLFRVRYAGCPAIDLSFSTSRRLEALQGDLAGRPRLSAALNSSSVPAGGPSALSRLIVSPSEA